MRLDIRKRFYFQSVVGNWTGSPGNGPIPKATTAPAAPGHRCHGIIGVSVLGWTIPAGPFQPRLFHDSMESAGTRAAPAEKRVNPSVAVLKATVPVVQPLGRDCRALPGSPCSRLLQTLGCRAGRVRAAKVSLGSQSFLWAAKVSLGSRTLGKSLLPVPVQEQPCSQGCSLSWLSKP